MPEQPTPEQPTPEQPVEGLHVETADGVRRYRFDRPAVHNALSGEMMLALAEGLEGLVAEDDVRVVVITGTGPAFSAGADLGAGEAGADAISRFDGRAMEVTGRAVRAIVRLDKPVVAAVNGIAAGVGASVALACDLVVAAESAAFLLPFTRIGLMPDGGTTATVAASIGRARAMRMALLGEVMPAGEAHALGLTSHLAPDAELTGTVEGVVRRLVAGPPLSLAASKKAVNAGSLGAGNDGPVGLEAALAAEHRGQVALFGTEDAAEGMRAFGEKRPPRFTGR